MKISTKVILSFIASFCIVWTINAGLGSLISGRNFFEASPTQYSIRILTALLLTNYLVNKFWQK